MMSTYSMCLYGEVALCNLGGIRATNEKMGRSFGYINKKHVESGNARP